MPLRLLALFSTALVLAQAGPALAGPVMCRTSLEAPLDREGRREGLPLEVTRCGAVQTVPELLERRYASWTAPYARGVDLTHQLTDLFGIAMGGGDGSRVMGLGFTDQTIVWDGSAVEATYRSLLNEQSAPLPLRVADRLEPVHGLW
ncbi:MAG: Occludin/ELL family protein [Synechococcus sp.]